MGIFRSSIRFKSIKIFITYAFYDFIEESNPVYVNIFAMDEMRQSKYLH